MRESLYHITLSKGLTHWLVDCEELDIHAIGETPLEAMQDFVSILEEIAEHYIGLREQDCIEAVLRTKQEFSAMFPNGV